MSSDLIGALLLWIIVAAIVITVVVYILRWLYRRSTKDTAFVRTGFMGEKVVVNGGAFVIPVLHEITPVNMGVLRISVVRENDHALITKNRMRVDLNAEFFVRVGASKDQVAAAAQTLGRRTLDRDGLTELLEGKFSAAMRSVAAQRSLEELHENRHDYAEAVRALAEGTVSANGLELENVSIVDLDQTGLEYFDPSNSFDAEGLTQLTETIETRRKLRNEIEQRTLVEIRNQNLDTQRKVLEIDRETEYAQLAQEQEIETRRAAQKTELVRERAMRDQEAEQARLQSSEAIEIARVMQERRLTQERIEKEEEAQKLDLKRRRALDEADLKMRELTEKEAIALELALEEARIARAETQERLNIARQSALELAEQDRKIALTIKAQELAKAESARRRAEIVANQGAEAEKLAQDRALDELRIARERHLESLQVAKRQAVQEAEIASDEEIERARLTAERGVKEAQLLTDQELRQIAVELDLKVDLAREDRAIALAKKSEERSIAVAAAETQRGKAIQAEEQAFTMREREIAERRKMTDMIAAHREAEREALALTAKAQAEMEAAKSTAEARRIAAAATAEAEKILAAAAAEKFGVDAEGARQLNEAENVLSEDARAGRLRAALLDRLEGIVRESVRPMEKIDGIKILHVDGMNGGGASGGKNVTDEVIDSALRYRVQAPMIDNLMKEIGIEGSSMGRMTDVLRNAKDIASLSKGDKSSVETVEKEDRDDD
ncbi:MAG: flotillin domain-containing protein [Heliomarina sp.]|uniref:flotillin domain-containing protein n=1 Tax=Heliomarina sp. TaxID=2917556 RepID=UPI00405871F3